MVVTATFEDDTTENVTEDCTFSPDTMAEGTQSVTVTYQRAGIQKTTTVAVAVRTLDHIAVTTAPTKTAYNYGETFNPAGMVVTAYYTDDTSRAVTGYTYSPTGALAMNNTTITISYSEGSVTEQTTQAITVSKVLDSIEITTPPTKTAYFSGETFNPAGMVVTAHYNDGSSAAVSGYTYSPSGALAAGNNTITVSYSEGGVTKTDTQAITVTTISNTLNSNSWATIKAVSDAGQGDNYWDVGDTKAITINGNVGNTNFSNLSINVYIIGFNHNSAREGNNRIHFKIGKIGGTQVALCDAQYGTSQSSNGYFNMNPNDSNSGGWANSYHRRTLLGNTGTPTSPPTNSLLAAMPADLRAVMKPVTKYSDNTGGGNNTASYVTSTTDYLFELAEFEYHGARTYANSAEQNYQQQYAYYQAGNSKIHYKHNATGTAAGVACRSVTATASGHFCLLSINGNAGSTNANYSWGVAPGFAA